MRKRTKAAVYGTVSVLALTAVSPAVLAADSTSCGGNTVAVANVSSNLLIREKADDDSDVIGYVPSAGGVIVKSVGEKWTKVEIGDKTGYVKTGYLAFDEKAEELKSVYGELGAVASWDDVKVFSDYEDTSSIIGSLDEGEGYEVLGSSDNWVEVQLKDGNTAYVAAEDVTMTAVLDNAVMLDESVSADSISEDTVQSAAPAAETEYVAPETESYVEETEYAAPETEYAYTDYTAETEYTDYTDYAAETEYVDYTAQTEYVDYTAETEYTDYTDYTAETEYYTEETTAPETESYVEETTATEAETTAATESTANVSSSDLDLLAALIYCEAGNQSMEGKIAVGQVVMNRVASSSFANTISGVIYEAGQFTPASTGQLDSVIGSAPSDCYEAALAAMNGEGTVGSALYFNTGSGKGVKIGAHQFY